ncbi:hypothetical protein D3218_10750 [Aureimonas flava]|uniref:Uncharacterized protein n=1 Tax=Aureimonas flava TaxID=2320271 RepID=A0A3A1WIR3_9HYPH|nr:hypothetical protein [Aureimonas flava]RIY00873.1 hypothetical protein D3218_10750 [Aureimonas flava]
MTIRNTADAELKALADSAIHQTLVALIERGVSFETAMDRLLTTAAAQIARHEGAEQTARIFRSMADNIQRGALVAVERRTTAN